MQVLVYSAHAARRFELATKLSTDLDVHVIQCANLETIRMAIERTPRALVLDHAEGDPMLVGIMRWLHAANQVHGIFHLSKTRGPSYAGLRWLTPEAPELSSLLREYFATSTHHHQNLDVFSATLDDLEKALDARSSTAEIARSLRDTHEILDSLAMGPSTLEFTSVVTNAAQPAEEDLRALITQLKALVDQNDPEKPRVMICGRDPRVPALRRRFGQDVAVSHVVHRDSLASACELLSPHVVVVFDESDRQTRDTLLQLRLISPMSNPAVVLIGGDTRPIDAQVAYDVIAAFDATVALDEISARATTLARARAAESPRVLIVDEVTKLGEVVHAVERMGGRVRHVSDPTETLTELHNTPVELVVLRNEYRHVSGLDVCRAIRRDFARLPVVMLLDHSDALSRSEAYRSGADDVLSWPLVMIEVQRRLRHLIELQRLRVQGAHRDEVTGARHITAMAGEFTKQFEGRSHAVASFAAFEVAGFSEIRAKYGEASARTVLRHVADSLTSHFGQECVFRGWGERFFVISRNVLQDDARQPPWSNVLDINRVTFRDNSGRGFYASLHVAHLVARPASVGASGCLEGLLRILARARATGAGHVLTARMEAPVDVAPPPPEAPTQRPNRWKPVVLTHSDD